MGWGSEDFVFLESLQIVRIKIADDLIKTGLSFCYLSGDDLLAFFLCTGSGGGLLGFFHLLRIISLSRSSRGLCRSSCRLGALGGRALLSRCRLGHRHLLMQFNVFTVDEIHRIGVNDPRMIGLALDFEIVRYEADWTPGVLQVMRFEG